MITGSCHCQKVRFEIRGKLGAITRCYCEDCRKLNGSAFAAVAVTQTADWHFACGESHITHYESSPGKLRGFCSTCHSPLYAYLTKQPELRRARLGTLDAPLNVGAAPNAHIFVAELCGLLYLI